MPDMTIGDALQVIRRLHQEYNSLARLEGVLRVLASADDRLAEADQLRKDIAKLMADRDALLVELNGLEGRMKAERSRALEAIAHEMNAARETADYEIGKARERVDQAQAQSEEAVKAAKERRAAAEREAQAAEARVQKAEAQLKALKDKL